MSSSPSLQKIITDTNKAPLVQVLALMFAVIAVLACFVRAGTKLYMIKTLKRDDILAIVATVFAVGQTIAVYVQCERGLGQPIESLSNDTIHSFFKSRYAADSLFLASLLCSKLSGTIGLRVMSRRSQKWLVRGCDIVVGVWGVSALMVNFFQCPLPMPWDSTDEDKCINRSAFWTYYSIANILTDVVIVAIMAENVRRIQTSRGKKVLVMGVFGSRILVVPAIAAQIYYTNRALSASDVTFAAWEASVAAQLVQCLAIFTVCVPNLKPFLDSLESGQIRVDDLRRQGKTSNNSYPSYRQGQSGYKSAPSSRNHRDATAVGTTSASSHRSNVHEMVTLPSTRSKAVALTSEEQQKESWDGQSHKSHSSQTILIHQTWQVDVRSLGGGSVGGAAK